MSEKKNSKIIQTDLKSLLKKFSTNDVVNKINEEYQTKNSLRVNPMLIEENRYLTSMSINEKKLDSIIKSIGEKGILSPLMVRLVDDKYEVIDGRWRLLAAKKLKIASVPVIIQHLSDEDMLVFMLYLMKNSRETKAMEISLLCRALSKEFNYKQKNLALIMDISRPQVTNLMRLLNLPEVVIGYLNDEKITYGHAKAIAALDEKNIEKVAKTIIEKSLSVRQTERLVQKLKNEQAQVKAIDISIDDFNKTIKVSFTNKKDYDKAVKKIKHLL